MISSIRHIGIVVSDMEASLKFYMDFLGLELYAKEMVENNSFVEQLVGLENVKVEGVKLAIPEGGLIELLQYHSHPDKNSPGNAIPSNRLGCSHVALTAKNLDELYRNLKENGYHSYSPPLLSANGKAKVLFCHDPDGSILELIEDM